MQVNSQCGAGVPRAVLGVGVIVDWVDQRNADRALTLGRHFVRVTTGQRERANNGGCYKDRAHGVPSLTLHNLPPR